MVKRLPLFKIENLPEAQIWQQSWSTALNPLLANPLLNGQLLEPFSLITGNNVISHKLGRKLQGWIVVGLSAATTLYDLQSTNNVPELTLTLNSSNSAVVTLYVF